jgi:spermidine/putrescine transport system permease protein
MMVEPKNFFISILHKSFFWLTYVFLYAPVFLIVLFSFNRSSSSYKWTGISLRWYYKLFLNPEIIDALTSSLIVATCSTLISVLLGTFLVVLGRKFGPVFSQMLFYPNIVLPDMVLAVSLLSFFVVFNVPLGYFSLIAGHTVVGLGFVVPMISSKFIELDPVLTEAALDLGATNLEAFRTILIPLLWPSLVASSLVVFTLSLDDFLIAFFCSGSKVQTISVYVYSQMKEVVDPSVNAISVLLLVVSSVAIIFLCFLRMVDRVVNYE